MAGQMCSWILVDRLGNRYTLTDHKIIIGSGACSLPLQLSGMDGVHCEMTFDKFSQQYRIQDNHSTEGTYVNGQRIPVGIGVELQEDDQLKFGSDPTIFVIEKVVIEVSNSAAQKTAEGSRLQEPEPTSKHPDGFTTTVWTKREVHSKMAECPDSQGCIAEQGIHHTCGECTPEEVNPAAVHCGENYTHHPSYHHHHSSVRPVDADTFISPSGHIESMYQNSVRSHDSARSHIRRTQSAHLDALQLPPGFPSVYGLPPPIDPYYRNHAYGGMTPSSPRDQYMPPYPSRPFYPPSVGYGYDPVRDYAVPARCATCEAFVSQYGFVPPAHLLEHQKPVFSPRDVDMKTHGRPAPYHHHDMHHQTQGETSHKPTLPYPEPGSPSAKGHMVKSMSFDHSYTDSSKVAWSSVARVRTAVLSPVIPSMSPNVLAQTSVHDTAISLASQAPLTSSATATSSHKIALTNWQSTCNGASQKLSTDVDTEDEPVRDCSSPGKHTKDSQASPITNTPTKSIGEPVSSPSPGQSPSIARKDHRRTIQDDSLHTVNKATPLYGQPAWWGHDTANSLCSSPKLSHSPDDTATRPTSLFIKDDPQLSLASTMQSSTPQETDQTVTSAVTVTTHTLSSYSAPAKPMTFTVDFFGDVKSPGKATAGPLAFTVDMNNKDEEGKKFAVNASLSQFLPKKVRRSVIERAAKIKQKDVDSPDKSGSSTAGSPNLHRHADGHPKTTHGYLSDGGHSASSDGEDLSFMSDIITTRQGPKAPPQTTRRSLTRPIKPTATIPKKSPQEPGASQPSTAGSKPSTSSSNQTITDKPSSQPSQPKSQKVSKPDNALALGRSKGSKSDYQLGTRPEVKGGSGGTFSGKPLTSTHPLSEVDLYQEARIYDSMIQSKASGQHRMSGVVARDTKSEGAQRRGEDQVSEAGTYTVDKQPPDQDHQRARQSIDMVFGVGPDPWAKFQVDRSVVQLMAAKVPDKSTSHPADVNGNMPAISDARKSSPDKTEAPRKVSTASVGKDVDPDELPPLPTVPPPTQKLQSLPDTPTPENSPRGSEQSPQGARQRRKLPTPPTNVRSTSSNDSPSKDAESAGRIRGSVTLDDWDKGQSFVVSYDAPSRRAKAYLHTASEETAGEPGNRRDVIETSKSAAAVLHDTKLDHVITQQPISVQVKKEGTFVIPRDGRGATHAHGGSGVAEVRLNLPKDGTNGRDDSGSDDSTHVVVDGDTSPNQKDSTRSAWRRYQVEDESPTSPPSKQVQAVTKRVTDPVSTRQVRKISQESTDHDESDTASTTSTDFSALSSPKLGNRGGSAGKAGLSFAKPNRTFMLRRQRNNTNSPPVALSRSEATELSSTAPPARPGSAKRVQQVRTRSSTGTESSKSDKTDVSRGKKIVQKSQENTRTAPVRTDAFTLKEHSRTHVPNARGKEVKDQGTPPSSGAASPAHSKKPGKFVANQSAGSGRSSSTTQSCRSSTGSGGSRTPVNQRKVEELAAWKRRQTYNPLKAIAQEKSRREEVVRSDSAGTNGFSSDVGNGAQAYDEITKLSSQVATDLSHMTHRVTSDSEECSESRHSAFTSTKSHSSAFHAVSTSKMSSSVSSLITPVAVKATAIVPQQCPLADRPLGESYDPLVIASVHQLSKQVKELTKNLIRTVNETSECEKDISPIEELMSPTIAAANPELTAALHNLRSTEHRLQVLNQVLNPSYDRGPPAHSDTDSTSSIHTDLEMHQYEVDRLREQAGFRPIIEQQQPAAAATTMTATASCKMNTSTSTSSKSSFYSATMTSSSKTTLAAVARSKSKHSILHS